MPNGRTVVARIVGAGAAGSVVGSLLAFLLLNQPSAGTVPYKETTGSIVSFLIMCSLPGTLIGAGVLTLFHAVLPAHLSGVLRAVALLFIGLLIGAIVPALPFLIGGKLIGVALFGGFGAFYAFCTTVFWLLLVYRTGPKDGS